MNMVSRWLIIIVLLVMALPVQSVSAAGENGYEIPLSELGKVEKKKPKKAETRKRKERKKADTANRATPREVSGGTPVATGQPARSMLETAQRGADITETPDSAHISHEPYSYVVPGKLTVIKAVISREGVQSVRCRFHTLDKGGYASVAMVKAPGSQFTYVATLPALKPGSAVLRYRFIVVDSSGIQTYSQGFVIPVKPTSVMPGWQQNPAKEPVRAALENPRQPLEGFSDVVIDDDIGL